MIKHESKINDFEISKTFLEKAMERYFGFSSFRNGQFEIIVSILKKQDSLAVLPTGGGKSLCYQLPALLMQGTALVISPLIALMKDQVDSLRQSGLSADFINSALNQSEINERIRRASAGEYKLLYIAPERLESRIFLEMLASLPLSFLAVDEAHCISEWGHDFRPAYMSIPSALDGFQNLPVAAFTATATPEVRLDIVKSLKMRSAKIFVRGFDRPNLSYITENCSEKIVRIAELSSRTKSGSVIVYCGSRKKVETINTALTTAGVENVRYHAGMEDGARKMAQDLFIQGKCKIIIATNAFGMGIDKPDVRFVIHTDFTQTLEAYYQEAGRAGRDGLPAECRLLYQPTDRKLQEFFINNSYPEFSDVAAVFNLLRSEMNSARYVDLSEVQIANMLGISSSYAKTIIELLSRSGVVSKNGAAGESTIRFLASRDRIAEYFDNTTGERKQTLEALLRSCGSEAFQIDAELSVAKLLYKFNISEEAFQSAIRALEFAGIIKFKQMSSNGGLCILSEITNPLNLPIDFDVIEQRRNRAFRKLDQVVRYAETPLCKRNFILEYFQEDGDREDCGRCSSCNFTHKPPVALKSQSATLLQLVLEALNEIDGRFGKVLLIDYLTGGDNDKIGNYGLDKGKCHASAKKHKPAAIRQEIEYAISAGLIAVSPGTYPTLSLTIEGAKKIRTPAAKLKIEPKNQIDERLFAKLEMLREEIADTECVVPRAVLSDNALRKLARATPQTQSALAGISGISTMFLSKFGKLFIQTIDEHLAEEREIAEERKVKPSDSQLLALLKNGETIENAAKFTRMPVPEAARIIQKQIEAGAKLSADGIISRIDFELLEKYIARNPYAPLREIRSELNLSADYPSLRIAAAIARAKTK